jgi:hypothetical protein
MRRCRKENLLSSPTGAFVGCLALLRYTAVHCCPTRHACNSELLRCRLAGAASSTRLRGADLRARLNLRKNVSNIDWKYIGGNQRTEETAEFEYEAGVIPNRRCAYSRRRRNGDTLGSGWLSLRDQNSSGASMPFAVKQYIGRSCVVNRCEARHCVKAHSLRGHEET